MCLEPTQCSTRLALRTFATALRGKEKNPHFTAWIQGINPGMLLLTDMLSDNWPQSKQGTFKENDRPKFSYHCANNNLVYSLGLNFHKILALMKTFKAILVIQSNPFVNKR